MNLLLVDKLQERVAAAISEEQTRLGKGMATDWADYRFRTGRIKGLEEIETIINDLTKDNK